MRQSRRQHITTLLLSMPTGWAALEATPATAQEKPKKRMIGLYVHQHWPYNHPYAARTWTLEDWRGWANGLNRIGYNTILVWPLLETIPEPMTPSDHAYLTKLGKVIDLIHQADMRVYLALCPNIRANNAEALKAPYEKRHYYYCDDLVNPGDPAALDSLVRWREKLMQPLRHVDGVAIIDSDPGCYPGSTNAEFVHLLAEHRKMFDRLRPGIELIYWMHAGWRGWSRFYETGKLVLGTPEEQLDTLTQLKAIDPEPWGLANGLPYAEKLGIAEKVISFNYGRIEGEPSFPMTNFTGQNALDGAKAPTARGVMGNAQTHCVQLPNIFAFACGAHGEVTLTEEDYRKFADDLIPEQGEIILKGWQAMASVDPVAINAIAAQLEQAAAQNPPGGKLQGLLFHDPQRFLLDLVKMLRLRAAVQELSAVTARKEDPKAALANLIHHAEIWQHQHGYQNNWYDPQLHTALRALNSPAINAVLNVTYEAREPFSPGITTPEAQVRKNFHDIETYTPRLLAAMKQALKEIHS